MRSPARVTYHERKAGVGATICIGTVGRTFGRWLGTITMTRRLQRHR